MTLNRKILDEISLFKRVAGPKRKQAIDYIDDIRNNLFPYLKEFGIEMYNNPMTSTPSRVTFAGKLDDRQIQIAFYYRFFE